jgi:hypothetical protein
MVDLTTNINYLQPTSFKLLIDRKHYPNLEFFCQSVSHPSMEMSAVETAFKKVAVPFSGDTLVFGALSCDIILDEDMHSYTEMFNWMRRNLDNNPANALDRTSRDAPNSADITLSILSSHNNQTRQIRYIDAIPTSIGTVQFQSTGSGTEYLTFTVDFRYIYFELLGVNSTTGGITSSLEKRTLQDGSTILTPRNYDSA